MHVCVCECMWACVGVRACARACVCVMSTWFMGAIGYRPLGIEINVIRLCPRISVQCGHLVHVQNKNSDQQFSTPILPNYMTEIASFSISNLEVSVSKEWIHLRSSSAGNALPGTLVLRSKMNINHYVSRDGPDKAEDVSVKIHEKD